MEYRINQRTGDRISVLGFGTSYIAQASERDAVATIQRAYAGGINYYDLATAEGRTFSYFGAALGAVRKNVFYQIHFGADYVSGTYGFSTDGETIRRSIEWQLKQIILIMGSSTVLMNCLTGRNLFPVDSCWMRQFHLLERR